MLPAETLVLLAALGMESKWDRSIWNAMSGISRARISAAIICSTRNCWFVIRRDGFRRLLSAVQSQRSSACNETKSEAI